MKKLIETTFSQRWKFMGHTIRVLPLKRTIWRGNIFAEQDGTFTVAVKGREAEYGWMTFKLAMERFTELLGEEINTNE